MPTEYTKISYQPLLPVIRDRIWVIEYLQRINVDGMTKKLTFSGPFVSLYDKNGVEHQVSRIAILKEVKDIVARIEKINKTE